MSFVERYRWSWESMQDPERTRARTLGATYQPHFILLDAAGDVVDTWEGRGNAVVWEAMLAKLP
jgi:hypothetical protein